ncbi:mucin-2-like, partial [Diachasma alloeum]|uniref:mucin-2-like n=1 Tax=Diachasma alloeum TaxID=454923 RepID=UPI0010FB2E64
LVAVIALFSAVAAKEDPTLDCMKQCPAINPNNDVYFVPHRNCSQFCSCNYGTAYIIPCPKGLYFSEKHNTCTWPRDANCKTARQIDEPIAFLRDQSPFDYRSYSPCIGSCPASDPPHLTVILEHQECGKYCKCVKGVPQEHKCPLDLHYSPVLGVCTYPGEAKCPRWTTPKPTPPACWCPGTDTSTPTVTVTHTATASSTATVTVTHTPTKTTIPTVTVTHTETAPTTPSLSVTHTPTKTTIPTVTVTHTETAPTTPSVTVTHTPTTTTIPTTTVTQTPTSTITPTTTVTVTPTPTNTLPPPGPTPHPDAKGCIGTCQYVNPVDVEQLPHIHCSKFCKCNFMEPVVFNCEKGLHYNPIKRVCDYPGRAECTGIKD